MDIWFLGTGAGRPTKERNVTSIALRLPDPDCALWLFDAGEATQHQFMRTPLKLNKLEALFVTHLHGDHTFGIPGLLSTRSYVGGNGPMKVFGPPGIRELVDTSLRLSGTRLDYEIAYTEIEEGIIFEDERFIVEARALEHRLPCFGYRITERDRPGKLQVEKLKELGVPEGPLYGSLKKGQDVSLPDGTVVRAAEVAGTPIKGRIVTILGDTKPCDNTVILGRDADLLVHEATFADGQQEKAHLYGHSTTVEAAEAARAAGARQLVMTHFSTRFTAEQIPALEQEAQEIFPESTAAYDLYHTSIACRQ
ncbi:ribonuclease Z [Paenibacillus radicis (ex Gao et al. 2016)]|uniref:Ribonuclease Z n=1 Tax=Paenibacillus radicis (ex Gao et al. 2016) TaxID=1737354 RepID=A0A917HRN9_9BACL|nr:ribonuclease Z [Paenibacillus radicis (ex Gao et al. 2016)]GGG88052.1 ribonuclease Z [Paenibacillus radicis (ex Gao et al. 2016)]